MKSAVVLNTYTFSGLLARCLGKRSGILLDVMLFLYGNGAEITYFVFMGDFLPNIVQTFYNGLPGWCEDAQHLRTGCLVAVSLAVLPMCMAKDLSALRFASPFALAGILYTAGVVFAKSPFRFQEIEDDDIQYAHFDISIFQSFSICVFAYNCHLNVVPVAQELQQPSDDRISKTTCRVALVQFCIYSLIGVGGYLSFLQAAPPNLLSAYPATDPLIFASRVMLSITMLVAIPSNALPTVRSVLCLLELCFPGLREETSGQQPLLASEQQPPEAALAPPCSRDTLRYLMTLLCLLFQLAVAIMVHDVASVVGFLGATVGTVMMLIIPVLIIHLACPDLYSPRKKWCVTVFFLFAAFMSLGSLVI